MLKTLLVSVLASSVFAHKESFERNDHDHDRGGHSHPDKRGRRAPPAPPAPVVNTCNGTRLSAVLFDFYGDGWDGVMLNIEAEGADTPMTFSPTCTDREITGDLTTDRDSTFYFTAIHPNSSYIPENNWEIFWTLTTHNCDDSIANVYTGGYNTSIIMEYVVNEWKIVYWENLWDNEKNCDACGDAKQCKPKKPKSNKGKDGKKKDNKKPGRGGPGGKPIDGDGDTDTDNSDTKNTTQSNTTHVAKPKPKYGPPAVNLRLTLFDEEGDGWWQKNYRGPSWFLADDLRRKLFFTGSLCDGSTGSCNLCLGDGSYTIRFTGEDSNFTAWDFCGVTGHYANELTFHVKKGQCYADSIVSRKTDCFSTVKSFVSLTGVVAISGFQNEVASANSNSHTAIAKTLSSMVQGWSAENIKIVTSTLDSRSITTSRKLSDFTQDFTFEVNFVAEEVFGVDGRSYSNVENLVSTLASTLQDKMYSGQFMTSMQSELSLSSIVVLAESSSAELLSLEISGVGYDGTEPMVISSLPEAVFSDTQYVPYYSIASYDTKSSIVFYGLAVAGFVAFVGLLSKGMSSAQTSEDYENLTDDSEAPGSDVNVFEMEMSNSPLDKAAFKVDVVPGTISLKL